MFDESRVFEILEGFVGDGNGFRHTSSFLLSFLFCKPKKSGNQMNSASASSTPRLQVGLTSLFQVGACLIKEA